MDICLIGKPPLDIASKPKRAPKQKKVVETVNSDSDSEFGIPKKTAAPKGKDYLCITLYYMPCRKHCLSCGIKFRDWVPILHCFNP